MSLLTQKPELILTHFTLYLLQQIVIVLSPIQQIAELVKKHIAPSL